MTLLSACAHAGTESGALAAHVAVAVRVDDAPQITSLTFARQNARPSARQAVVTLTRARDDGDDIHLLRLVPGTYCLTRVDAGDVASTLVGPPRCFQARADARTVPGVLVIRGRGLAPATCGPAPASTLRASWSLPDERLLARVWREWPESDAPVQLAAGLR